MKKNDNEIMSLEKLKKENTTLNKKILLMHKKYNEIKEKILEFQKNYANIVNNYKNKQNFLERQNKKSKSELKYANFEFAKSLLDPIDWLEKTLISVPKDNNPWVLGLNKVLHSLQENLEKFHIKEIITKVGDPIDANYMETIDVEESSSKNIKKVSSIIQKGYTLHEKVLRFVRVKVGK